MKLIGPAALVAAFAFLAAPTPAQQPSGDRANRSQEPVPPLPYAALEVTYANPAAGIELAGTLTVPPGEGPFPAVVLVSGSGPQDRDSDVFGHKPFLVLSDYLTRRGIAVLRSDDRGVGASGGDFVSATTEDFASDASAAAAWLRARPEVDGDAVGVVGMSEGGLVAPMVAARGDVAYVVLMAAPGTPGERILLRQSELIARAMGAPDGQIDYNRSVQEGVFEVIVSEPDPAERARRIEETLRARFAELSAAEKAAVGLTPAAEAQFIASQVEQLATPWFRFFLLHDPTETLRRVRVPVLAMGGGLDLQVPAEENLAAIEAALREGGNQDVTIVRLPGLNHLFQPAASGAPAEYPLISETMSEEAMETVAAWILERAGTP